MLLALTLGAVSAAAAKNVSREELADHVRDGATVRVSESFALPCPSKTALASLRQPLVMAALWNSYGFAPAYQVTPGEEGAVHVVDPTGLTGDLWTLSAGPGHVVFLGAGTLTHWGIPGLRHGTAVFDVDLEARGDSTLMDVTVSLKPDVWLARAGLWMLAPIAHGRIEKRMMNNVRDAGVILADIVQKPDSVATRLSGELRSEFAAAFAR
jgi:hypothetical protein